VPIQMSLSPIGPRVPVEKKYHKLLMMLMHLWRLINADRRTRACHQLVRSLRCARNGDGRRCGPWPWNHHARRSAPWPTPFQAATQRPD
jgi:hypothetical protein